MSFARQAVLILLLAVAAGGAGLWAGAYWTGRSPPPGSGPETPAGAALKVGDTIPALTLADRAGQPRGLAEWRGRPLLINFWASWCAPCIEEMPLLDAFAAEQGSNGVQVVGIALDEPAAIERFLAQSPVSYPILLDQAGPVDSSARLGNRIGGLPFSVLIDADGRLLGQKLGPFRDDQLQRWVNATR